MGRSGISGAMVVERVGGERRRAQRDSADDARTRPRFLTGSPPIPVVRGTGGVLPSTTSAALVIAPRPYVASAARTLVESRGSSGVAIRRRCSNCGATPAIAAAACRRRTAMGRAARIHIRRGQQSSLRWIAHGFRMRYGLPAAWTEMTHHMRFLADRGETPRARGGEARGQGATTENTGIIEGEQAARGDASRPNELRSPRDASPRLLRSHRRVGRQAELAGRRPTSC